MCGAHPKSSNELLRPKSYLGLFLNRFDNAPETQRVTRAENNSQLANRNGFQISSSQRFNILSLPNLLIYTSYIIYGMDLQSLLSQVIQWHKDSQYEPIVQLVSFISKIKI